jgi:hypothetical protein
LTAQFMFARGLVRRCGEVLIAASTAPTARDHQALVRTGEVVNALPCVRVKKNRSHRNLEDDVVALLPGSIGTFAVPSTFGPVFRIEAEVDERVVAFARFHYHVSTVPTVAAGGAAARDKFLPAECHAAIPAVPGLHPNFSFIDEHEKKLSAFSIQHSAISCQHSAFS